jgi:hypothetical protein
MISEIIAQIQVIKLMVKLKVKFPLCLNKHHAIKTNRGSGGIDPRILDLASR